MVQDFVKQAMAQTTKALLALNALSENIKIRLITLLVDRALRQVTQAVVGCQQAHVMKDTAPVIMDPHALYVLLVLLSKPRLAILDASRVLRITRAAEAHLLVRVKLDMAHLMQVFSASNALLANIIPGLQSTLHVPLVRRANINL